MDISKDIDGKESSKRKLGMRLLNIAIVMALIHFAAGLVCAVLSRVYEYEFPLSIWWSFMGTGAGLLGITLFERISKK